MTMDRSVHTLLPPVIRISSGNFLNVSRDMRLNSNHMRLPSSILGGGGLFDAFSPDSEMFGQLGQSASEFIDNTFSDARLREVVCGSTMKMDLDRETLPLYVYAQVNNSFIESSWRLGSDEETGESGGALI